MRKPGPRSPYVNSSELSDPHLKRMKTSVSGKTVVPNDKILYSLAAFVALTVMEHQVARS